MEPIKDLSELQPVLAALEAKQLVAYLTPPGRGSIVTHTLYLDQEMEKVRREAKAHAAADSPDDGGPPRPEAAPSGRTYDRPRGAANPAHSASGGGNELRQLREELADLRREFEAARVEWEATAAQLREQLGELHRQLGI